MAQFLGTLLVLIALVDIYLTVLYPRSNKGWVSVKMRRLMWLIFRFTANARLLKSIGLRTIFNRSILSYSGPTILLVVISVWVLFLLFGFALIFWPALGSGIQAGDGPTPTDFMTAFYLSGYILTTLGMGDIVPETGIYRLLAILEAALGFSVFTLTITYLLAVYSALTQRNIFALRLHYRTNGTGDALEMLARYGQDGDFAEVREDISGMSLNLLTLLESHHAYPVVHYFRFRESYYALSRLVLIAMDTATLLKSALHEDRYRALINCTAVAELSGGGRHLLSELAESFLPGQKSCEYQTPELLLRQRYYRAVDRLRQEGVETVADVEAGADRYVSLRWQWEPDVRAIAHYMAYEWHEIDPYERDIERNLLHRVLN
ncbi:MAG TPA: potassium channel family protein [Leptolyngbyaceae cyanobacterium]